MGVAEAGNEDAVLEIIAVEVLAIAVWVAKGPGEISLDWQADRRSKTNPSQLNLARRQNIFNLQRPVSMEPERTPRSR